MIKKILVDAVPEERQKTEDKEQHQAKLEGKEPEECLAKKKRQNTGIKRRTNKVLPRALAILGEARLDFEKFEGRLAKVKRKVKNRRTAEALLRAFDDKKRLAEEQRQAELERSQDEAKQREMHV